MAGILTCLLVINCILLVLLVLVQLPKKDAGVGMAFGGGAADALFGAGSGNALTKITKWGTGIFFALALILGLMDVKLSSGSTKEFESAVQQGQSQLPVGQPPAAPAAPAATAPATTNAPALLLLSPTNSAAGTAQVARCFFSSAPAKFISRARFVFFDCRLLLLIFGCVRREPPADITIINGAEPESLDPAMDTGQPEMRIVIGLFEGLTRLDPKTARPIPGMAEAGTFRRMEKPTRFICGQIWSGPPAKPSRRTMWFIPGFAR